MLHELSNNVDLFFVECQSAEDVMSYYDSSLAVRNLKKEVGHYFFKVKSGKSALKWEVELFFISCLVTFLS